MDNETIFKFVDKNGKPVTNAQISLNGHIYQTDWLGVVYGLKTKDEVIREVEDIVNNNAPTEEMFNLLREAKEAKEARCNEISQRAKFWKNKARERERKRKEQLANQPICQACNQRIPLPKE